VRGRPPSPILDAHFRDQVVKTKGGAHMGPGSTMYWFYARIEIDPNDADAWAGRTTPTEPPRNWRRDRNPLSHPPTAGWAMTPEDFDGAKWYDPLPLFGSSAHRGYKGGHMAINKAGNAVFVWQHWR